MTDAFNRWWDAEELVEGNPYNKNTPAYWAWAGWQAGQVGMTDEEYEQAGRDANLRTMLEIDTEVRGLINKAVEMEREACAKVCEPQEEWDDPLTACHIAAAIRARGQG